MLEELKLMLSDFDKKCIEDIKVKTGINIKTVFKYYDENNHDYEKALAAIKEQECPLSSSECIRNVELKIDEAEKQATFSDHDRKSIEKIQVETGADLKTAIQSYRENNNDCEKVLLKHWIRCIRIATGTTEEIAEKYYEEDNHDLEKTIVDIKEEMKPKVTDEPSDEEQYNHVISQEEIFEELSDIIKKYGPSIANINGAFSDSSNLKSKAVDNAIKTYAKGLDKANIIGMIDNSFTNNGKTALIFTTAGFYLKDTLSKPVYVRYDDILETSISQKAKKDCNSILSIMGTNGNTIKITSSFFNKTPFKDCLDEISILAREGETAESDKFLIIEDMKESVKLNYLNIIVNFANLDNQISGQELSAIYLLMTRIKTDSKTRQAVMCYISEDQSSSTNALLDNMDDEVPKSTMNVLHLSLIKDILMVSGGHYPELSSEQLNFISSICTKYKINKDQISVLQKALDLDKQFLDGNIDDKQYAKMVSDLGAKAAAIGVPVAAIYLSGSVVGLSAAGITSGLASLGLGGVLGLSSMVTGVGVAVLISVATYKGIKWIMGHGKKDRINKREYLLQEAISMNQKTISALIEDMNNLTKDLIDAISEDKINAETIRRLKKKISLFASAFKKATQQDDEMTNKMLTVLSTEINHE